MIYRFGDYAFDTEISRLTVNFNEVSIAPRVFSLVQFLIENRDRVVSKGEIIEHVWDGRIVSKGTLNSHINTARRVFGDNGETQAVIKTYPRLGLRFVAEVSEDIISDTNVRGWGDSVKSRNLE